MGDFSVITSLNCSLGGSGSLKGISVDFSFLGGSEPCFVQVDVAAL